MEPFEIASISGRLVYQISPGSSRKTSVFLCSLTSYLKCHFTLNCQKRQRGKQQAHHQEEVKAETLPVLSEFIHISMACYTGVFIFMTRAYPLTSGIRTFPWNVQTFRIIYFPAALPHTCIHKHTRFYPHSLDHTAVHNQTAA